LCLACVAACPSGALSSHPERPQLAFSEAACIQCGLCRTTCPEDAVALAPRLLLTAAARERVVLHEEEPFACIRCGKAFGVGATVERVLARLADHPSFAGDTAALDRISMCEDCRVVVQFEAKAPMAGPPRPYPRTGDD
jgi:Fe-S-cluster-containing dehydrogenase component